MFINVPQNQDIDTQENLYDSEIRRLRDDFRQEVGAFLERAQINECPAFTIRPDAANGDPVYIVTGIGFTPYAPETHGTEPTHAFYNGRRDYVMNNTAAVLQRLMDDGHRVVAHIKGDTDLAGNLIAAHPNSDKVKIVGGDLTEPEVLHDIYGAMAGFGEEQPINNVRMILYQSFAQGNGSPFNPIHIEKPEEVERAASRRTRFVYNMAAMGYDMLMNKGLDDLRIVSLSALAAQRATYGLLADAADKFMNELTWRTFHLEANISTGKPVSVYQVNPGITTACDIYRNPQSRTLIKRESLADGFPMDENVFADDRTPLPQLSANDVAWVADTLARTPDGADPNENMPAQIKSLLYGGFTPEDLRARFQQAIAMIDGNIEVDPAHALPEHIMTPGVKYGALPDKVEKGAYKRISLTPVGQRF